MHPPAVKLRREVREAVDRRFLSTPVEVVPPLVDELPHVGHTQAVLPTALAELRDPARTGKSAVKGSSSSDWETLTSNA